MEQIRAVVSHKNTTDQILRYFLSLCIQYSVPLYILDNNKEFLLYWPKSK